jgi:fermentation-respiration switch protein FrsA (DUF1100 family)
MKRVRLILLSLMAMAWGLMASAAAQDIAGDWQGTLDTGGPQLRLVLHITKNADGSLHAALDSVDQGANGIPASVSLKEARVHLDVPAVHGTYDGKLSADGSTIKGTWSQGTPMALDFARAAAPIKTEHKAAPPTDIDGAWMGTLDAGVAKLRVVFHFNNTEDGLMGTLDSPDQNAKGIPLSTVTRNGDALKIEVKSVGGVFEGTINKDRSGIDGNWTQAGKPMPLALKRVHDMAEVERKRPQVPAKPYPYKEEEVSYDNPAAAGVKLAATFTIPQGKGPFPAVLLITGSGPQDRDEALMGHRPFLILADYLTRHGIAVLRADDRGFAKSTGNFSGATTADFATDAEAGVAYLKSRPEVDPRKIGLIGHSEGGLIAPMVAARNHDVAFIVMMAGPGVNGEEILVEQGRLINEASGMSHEKAVQDAADERTMLDLIKQEKDDAVLEKKLREMLAGKVPEAMVGTQVKQVMSAWFRYFISYDPAVTLRKVTCPVLAINGEKDLQVPPKQNLPIIRKALEEGGNKNFEVDELLGLNHLFQTAKTGALSEYAEIEETMSPVALEKMAGWVLKIVANS